MKNGGKAANGFAALAELDSNGDGVFNALDDQFNDLRIWRDLNQDGISQASELQSLTNSGVQSIKIESTQTNTNIGDAILAQESTFVKADGSTQKAGSFNLAQNNFIQEFAAIDLSDDAKNVLNIGGTGWVRDLQEAATLDPTLITLFNQIKATDNHADYYSAVSKLLLEWGAQSIYNNASKQAVENGWGLILSEPKDDQERSWMDAAIKAGKNEREAFRANLSEDNQVKFDAMRERMVGGLEKLYTYEAFTGHTFLNWGKVKADALIMTQNASAPHGIPVVTWQPLSVILANSKIASRSSQEGYIHITSLNSITAGALSTSPVDDYWNRLVNDAATNLASISPSADYLDLLEVKLTAEGIKVGFDRLDEKLAAAFLSDSYQGAMNLLDFSQFYGDSLAQMGWGRNSLLEALYLKLDSDENIKNALVDYGYNIITDSSAEGTISNDIYLGDETSNHFKAGAHDDILIGGKGNDVLQGGQGNDVYIYRLGDGSDTINNEDKSENRYDALRFDDSIKASEVTVSRSGEDLHIRLQDESIITIEKYLNNDGNGGYALDAIEFDDGTTWNIEQIRQKLIQPSEARDVIIGYAGNEILNGLGGNDDLEGRAGNDILDGGSGDDVLSGGTGDDIYLFGKGDGHDRIDNNDQSEGRIDILRFKAGITPENVKTARSGMNLVLDLGDDNSVTIINYFAEHTHGGYALNQIQFADGRAWTVDDIKAQVLVPSLMDDRMDGYETNDQLSGLSGNDQLYGHEGDDTLRGGKGDDRLEGGQGDDLYLYEKGDGHDRINNRGNTDTDKDRLKLGEGISADDVKVERIGNQLVLTMDAENSVTVENYFNDRGRTGNVLSEIQFADGRVWTVAGMKRKVLIPTDNDDRIIGYETNDVLSGLKGNDNIYGYEGADTLAGGQGNDFLDGGEGNDSLTGGKGDDYLEGGKGNDTYYYAIGDGHDTFGERVQKGAINSVHFAEGIRRDDITVHRRGNDLLLTIDKNNSVTLSSYFYDDQQNGLRFSDIQFADGTHWSNDYLRAVVLTPTDGADELHGYGVNDVINGLAGDDQIYGNKGDDQLQGGLGDDSLSGEEGDDQLTGGKGNDYLSGGPGNDTYHYQPGDGKDILLDGYGDDVNQLFFDGGLTPEQIQITRDSFDLVLTIDTENAMRVRNYFSGEPNIQRIHFDNGASWDAEYIKQEVLKPTNQKDIIDGYSANETLNGLEGDDVIRGHGGDDRLQGGKGNDYLEGGSGKDTFVFLRGDGSDTIGHHGRAVYTPEDRIVFSDIQANEVLARRQGVDLLLQVSNSQDAIRVADYFGDTFSRSALVKTVEFADGSLWTADDIHQKVLMATDEKDQIIGSDTRDDALSGLGGDDYIIGKKGGR